MNPYVRFQEGLIDWLSKLLAEEPDKVAELAFVCRSTAAPDVSWRNFLQRWGFDYANASFKPDDYPESYKLWEIILEQIDDSGNEILIRNLLGMPLCRVGYTVASSLEEKGARSDCLLRSATFSQAAALNAGDILVSGERVVHAPRSGGNGDVLICLENESRPHVWMEIAHRFVLALSHREGEQPTAGVLSIAA